MGRPANTEFRQQWYEEKLREKKDPRGRFDTLRGKLAADIKKLPEPLRNGAYEQAISAVQGVIDAVGDALEDSAPRRRTGMSA